MTEHGLNRYGNGCRCEICRAGKAAYSRTQRATAREARLAAEAEGRRYVVVGITHGVSGYKNHSCRCLTCRLSASASSAEYRRRRAQEWAAGERGEE